MTQELTAEEAIGIIQRWQAGNFATRIDDMNPALNLAVKALRNEAQLAKCKHRLDSKSDQVLTELWDNKKDAVYDQARDRPDREKIADEVKLPSTMEDMRHWQLRIADQILAKIPDEEERRKQERERIIVHLEKLFKNSPIRTGSLRRELGEYVQALKRRGEE